MNILFHITPYRCPTEANYWHNIVALAEGLEHTKNLYYGNIDYWYSLENNDYLIKKRPDGYIADINIYCSDFFESHPDALNKIDYKKVNILIDMEDGLFTKAMDDKYERFNFILRSHYNKHIKYPSNVIPWAFGLTNRMINSIDKNANAITQPAILNTFRIPHSIRQILCDRLRPLLSPHLPIANSITDALEQKEETDILQNNSYWSQTGRRHNDLYYKTINQYRFTYAFGGVHAFNPIEPTFINKFKRKINMLHNRFSQDPPYNNRNLFLIYQYDSWRFWEALYSNSIPIQLDFEYWGFELPIMPVKNMHYLGIEKLDCKDFCNKIVELSDEAINNISLKGKEWCLNNYSPASTATRLIQLIERLNK